MEKGNVVTFGLEPIKTYIHSVQTGPRILMEKREEVPSGPLREGGGCGLQLAGVMRTRDRLAVGLQWVCGVQGGEVGHNGGEWGEFADFLKSEVDKTRAETPEVKVDREEANDENAHECGKRDARPMLDPNLPSWAEVWLHNLTQMLYRNWCPHCLRGWGKEMDHKSRKEDKEVSLPEYHLDYCFPRDEDGQKLTILVVVERRSEMKKGMVVPSKSSTGKYAAKMVMELMQECGDKDTRAGRSP